MKRAVPLLGILAAVLLVMVWYLLAWSPRTDELAATEQAIVDRQTQQVVTANRITTLQQVRHDAASLSADLAASDALIPDAPNLAGALRQLQQAAQDSGALLVSVAPSRPQLVDGTEGLYAFTLNAELRGGYFQIVDVLRRLEEPAISPRGVVWDRTSMTVDEHPELVAVLTGRMFATLPAPPDDTTSPVSPEITPDAEDPDTAGEVAAADLEEQQP